MINKERKKECNRKYRKTHKKEIADYGRKYYKKHKKRIAIRAVEYYQINKKDRKEYATQYHKTHPKSIYKLYIRGAMARGLRFDLSFEKFEELIKQPCTYCGEPRCEPYFNGIDREMNDKGYTIENVVACCWKCNIMKWKYTKEEFINHCRKITKLNE